MVRNRWYQKEIDELVESLAKAGTFEEVAEILEIISTPREINDMARRLKIKEMLESGKTYSEIATVLEVSPTIISRISAGVGFGFRRSKAEIVEKRVAKKEPKRYLYYKGVKTFIRKP